MDAIMVALYVSGYNACTGPWPPPPVTHAVSLSMLTIVSPIGPCQNHNLQYCFKPRG